ncbi:exosortase/archaeosortase family protein [Paeniglutamicibacter sp. NPDC012692]|uniref:exosortase/archaeosortase family protein n=1 Tax=Paeniglutamicibacter sp. NPDC012692 TaxID=3364388 RepID=UPI0036C9FE34
MSLTKNQPRESPTTRRKAPKAHQFTAVGLLLAMLVSLLAHEHVRRVEARIAGWAIETFMDVGTYMEPYGTYLTIGAGTQHIFTLDVTFACSVVLLTAPLLLVAALLLFSGRGSLSLTIPAALVGVAILVAINTLRIMLIAALTRENNLDGFALAHTVYGSLLVLIGLAFVQVLFVKTVIKKRR